jgi:preprotein translocase subunit SecD
MNHPLAMIVIGLAAGLVSSTDDVPAAKRADDATLEFRLAETMPGDGLTEAKVEGTGEKVYLRSSPIVGLSGIERVYPTQDANLNPALGLDFTAEVAKKMTAATEGHKGKPVAVLLDGKVIAAPKVNYPIKDRAVISGLTEPQMRRIIEVAKRQE